MFNPRIKGPELWDNPNAPTDFGALVDLRQVTTQLSRLFTAVVFNTAVGARYVQLFDSATAPTNGSTALMQIKVPADSYGSFDFGPYGRQFGKGIVIVSSTTSAILTKGGTDLMTDIGYRLGH